MISIEIIGPSRLSEGFELLRELSIKYKKKFGRPPQVFLMTMGTQKDFRARADFSKSFFETAGFEVYYPNGFSNNSNAVDDLLESGSRVAVICSTDENYPNIVAPLCKTIQERTKDIQIILAGYPKENIDKYRNIGVNDFIFLGANVFEILYSLLIKIGADEE
jgi:methylmalonyl-CoA mutase